MAFGRIGKEKKEAAKEESRILKREERIGEARTKGEIKAQQARVKAEAKERRGLAFSEGTKRTLKKLLWVIPLIVIIIFLILFTYGTAQAGTLQIWGKEIGAWAKPLWDSAKTGIYDLVDPKRYDPTYTPQKKEDKEKNIILERLESTKKTWGQDEVIKVRGRVKVHAPGDGEDAIESDLEVRFSCEMEDYEGRVEISIDGEKRDTKIIMEGDTEQYDVECKFLDKVSFTGDNTDKNVILKASLDNAITIVRLRVYHLIEEKLREVKEAGLDPLEEPKRQGLVDENRFLIPECLHGCSVPMELNLRTNAQPLHEDAETETDYSLDIELLHQKSDWEGMLKEIKLLELEHTSRLIPLEEDCALGSDLELRGGDKLLDRINENLNILRLEKDESRLDKTLQVFDPDKILIQCKFKVDAGEEYPPSWEEFKGKLVYDYEAKSSPETIIIEKGVTVA